MRSFFTKLRAVCLPLGALALMAFGPLKCTTDPDPGTTVWPSWGGDLENTHEARGSAINADNVHELQQKWVVRTVGNVSAIPTLSTTRVYFPDWGIPLLGGSQL